MRGVSNFHHQSERKRERSYTSKLDSILEVAKRKQGMLSSLIIIICEIHEILRPLYDVIYSSFVIASIEELKNQFLNQNPIFNLNFFSEMLKLYIQTHH